MTMRIGLTLFALCLVMSFSGSAYAQDKGQAKGQAKGQGKGTWRKEAFGKTADGQEVELYTLPHSRGVEVKITTYGGIVTSLKVPDRAGRMGDVVLGFDTLDPYLKGHPFFGTIVGRYG